jgi:hypothetical protein
MSSPTNTFFSGALRKILMVIGGILGFLVLASMICVWALGRFAPSLIDSTLASKAGAHLSVEANDSNLFAGKLIFSGITVTNPSRWTEREGLKIKRLALDFESWSLWGEGTRVIREADVDIETLVVVGKADWLKDNNIQDISKGLKAAETPAPPPQPSKSTTPATPAQPFKIEKLHLRIGRVVIIAADGTPDRHVVIDRELNFVFEARGVTENNFGETVSSPLGKAALQKAGDAAPMLIMDITRERLRRSITEKLQNEQKAPR